MIVLFIESQKKGKIRTCLHFHLPASLASYPLTWYNDEEISVPPWPSRVWTGEGVGGLGRERSVGGGHDLVDSEAFCLLGAPPYAQWPCSGVIWEETFTSPPAPSSFEKNY